MNRIRLFILFLMMVIIGISSCENGLKEDNSTRMINVKRLLKTYGFKNGKVEGISSPMSDEGYITVTFIDPFVSTDKKLMQIVREEIPPNKIGALRVFSLWLFKTAYYPENKKDYIESINDVRDNFLKKGVDLELIAPVKGEYKIPPMTFTDEEIMEYYSKAIRNQIEGIALKTVSSDEAKQLRELLITYCVAPTKGNGEAFTKYAKEVGNTKPEKATAIDAFMEELSPELKKTLGL